MPKISVQTDGVLEGDGPVEREIELVLSSPTTEPVSVEFEVAAHPYEPAAVAGEEFIPTSGTLIFLPGETMKSFRLQVLGDRRYGRDEKIDIRLKNGVNASAWSRTILILNDDPPPAAHVSDAEVVERDEGTNHVTLTVRLDQSAEVVVEGEVRAFGGTATAGVDFARPFPRRGYLPPEAPWGRVSFQPGVTEATFPIAIVGDLNDEGDEWFLTRVTPLSQYSLAALSVGRTGRLGVVRIVDDDALPGRPHHIEWVSSPEEGRTSDPQHVILRAVDSEGRLASNYHGTATIERMDGPVPPFRRVLMFTAFAGESAVRIRAAILPHFNRFIETALESTDPEALREALKNTDVFLIPPQDDAPEEILQEVGEAWAPILNEFVWAGGRIVVCSYEHDEHLLGIPWLENVWKIPYTAGRLEAGFTFDGFSERFWSIPNWDEFYGYGAVAFAGPDRRGFTAWARGEVVLIGIDYRQLGTPLDGWLASAISRPGQSDSYFVPRFLPHWAPTSAGQVTITNGMGAGDFLMEFGTAISLRATGDLPGEAFTEPFEVLVPDDVFLTVEPSVPLFEMRGTGAVKFTIRNSGPSIAAGVYFTNSFINPISSATATRGQVTHGEVNSVQHWAVWDIGEMQPDETLELTIEFKVRGIPVHSTSVLSRSGLGGGERIYRNVFPALMPPELLITPRGWLEGSAGDNIQTLNIQLSYPYSWPVSFDYSITAGTAHAGEDFLPLTGRAVLPPGATTHSVAVTLTGDTEPEEDETILLDVFNAQNVRTSTGSIQFILTIGDDDTAWGDDQDSDGLPELWERRHGLDPFEAADALADLDGDGLSNLDEFILGTDPRDSASGLRLRSFLEEADGFQRFVCEFDTVPGRIYYLESAPFGETPSYILGKFYTYGVAVGDGHPARLSQFWSATTGVPWFSRLRAERMDFTPPTE